MTIETTTHFHIMSGSMRMDSGKLNHPLTWIFRAAFIWLSTLAAGFAQTHISCDQELNGIIASPGQQNTYTFHADAGNTIYISLAKMSGGDANFTPGLIIHGPTGQYIGAAGSRTVPATGTYTITVFDNHNGYPYIGSYRLCFFRIPANHGIADDGGALTNGGNHDGALGLRGDLDAWTFNANAGDMIIIGLVRTPGGDPNFLPGFQIYDPDGDYLPTAGALTATLSGAYTIIVSEQHNGLPYVGNYRLHYFLIPGNFTIADDGGILPRDVNQSGSTGHPGDIDAWTFHATAGKTITLSGARTSYDLDSRYLPTCRHFGPDGTHQRTLDFGVPRSTSIVAPKTGIYTITVRDDSGFGTFTGGYQLRVEIPQDVPSRAPVLFIPGIAGSELTGGAYHGGGSYLWPTIRPDKMEDLHLTKGVQDVQAVGVIENFVLAGDIGVPKTVPVYGPFLDHLRGSGYVEFPLNEDPSRLISGYMLSQNWPQKPELFTFPYDWRKENASHTGTLHTYISHIRQLHGGAKVRVVSHSMGALLLRRYMIDYGTDDFASVVTVAPPAWGAPQAVFRLHTGLFFGPEIGEKTVIDWITRDEMKSSLWSFPAVAELLPSAYYMLHGGALLFTEAGWDYNRNGDSSEIYDPVDYFSLMTDEAIRQGSHFNPILVNQAFHTPAQDDWSDIPASIPVLQISGHSRNYGIFETTPWSMVAHGGAWWTSLNPGGIGANIFDHQRIDPIFGPGDGTVPLLSSERFPAYRAPNTIDRRMTGKAEASHMGLFSENPEMAAMIVEFLSTGSVSGPSPAPSPRIPKDPEEEPSLVSILIKGRGFAKITSGDGDENTRYTAMAAAKVPRVEIRYAKDSVLLGFEAGEAVTVVDESETTGTQPLEVEIASMDGSGTLTALRRYRAEPEAGRWKIQEDEEGSVSFFIDANSDGLFQAGEELAPVQAQEGVLMDTTAPRISLEIQITEQGVSVVLSGSDDSGTAPTLRHSINAGAVEDYTAPISFAPGSSVKLAAFAEDAAGNASGLIETSIQPRIKPDMPGGGGFRMSWPAAEAYVVQESGDSSGPWTEVEVPVQKSGDQEWIEIPVAEAQRFYRLNSRTLQR